ncbi:hypothetical protein EDB80DRAFT_870257 [Ilyonectria destructans]|nr:hypothetical protein EDB80DRAFT_870257 [Ilyonectria destructans]
MAFLGANAVALSAGIGNITGFIRRSRLISVVNLVPLFPGGQMNIIASRYRLSLRAYARMHRWMGSVAVAEGLLHVTVSVSRQMPNLKLRTDVAGLVAASIFLIILPSGLLRQRLYEVFLTIHFTLSLAALTALGLSAAFTGCIRFGLVLYRNVRYRRPLCRASVRTITFKRSTGEDIPLSDAVHLHIRLSRSWKHRAGEYVYFCMPGLGTAREFVQLILEVLGDA